MKLTWIKSFSVLFFLLGTIVQLEAQSAHSFLREGDQEYKKKKYDVAEEKYRLSLIHI